jgi:Tol biopolymer transport system component
MLTGRRLFEGETVSDILAEVLKTEPDWGRLPAETPPAARRLLQRCLQRDPQRRLHHMADAGLEIDEALANPDPLPDGTLAGAPAKAAPGKERLVWLAMVTGLLAALAAVALWPDPAPERQLVQSMMMPPVGWDHASASPFAVSPDGRQVAFVANPRAGSEESAGESSAIWIRDLAAAEARRLIDAEVEAYPFWSPDGRWIGFFGDGKLNKILVEGGPVVPICDATEGRGGTWNADGTIVFQRDWSESLMKVAAGGGTPEPVTTLDKDRFDIAHRWPHFLPDGRHFLYYVVSTTNPANSEHSGIYVGSLDSDETRLLMRSESRALFSDGHLLFRAGSTLMAQPFDTSTFAITGDPSPVSTDVPGGAISWGGANFGAGGGVIVHLRGIRSSLSALTWRDREGNELDTIDEPAGYWEPALSHDGKRLAVAVGIQAADIWIYDLERDTRTRFTFDTADDRQPLWSPDDDRLVFTSSRASRGEIWMRPTSGQEAELLFSVDANIVLTDWSTDGRYIFFSTTNREDNSIDLWAFDTESSQASPVATGPFDQQGASLSPDRKWLAFVSDESGPGEVYVQRFPEADGRWMVSSDGGARGAFQPTWSDDGRELLYYRDGTVLAVPVTPGTEFSFGKPQVLFPVTVKSGQGNVMLVTDRGQRILTNELPPVDPGKSGARLIQNWLEGLAVP